MEKKGFKYSPWIPLIVGTVLRVVDLGGRSLWVDEGLSAGLVSEPFGDMLNACVAHGQAVFFYMVMWPWVRIWEVSEVSLGAFSAIFGILTIYIVYLLIRQLAGKKEAFLAALITAVAPFMIYASNDARPYSFLGFISVTAVYFFLQAITTNKTKYWILTGIFTAACPYTHLLGWSVALFEVLYLLLAKAYRQWPFMRNLALTLMGVAIVYIPLAFATLKQIRMYEIGASSPVGESGAGLGRFIFVAGKQFLSGFYRILCGYSFIDLGGSGLASISGIDIIHFVLTLVVGFGLPLLVLIYLIKHKPKWGLFLLLMYITPFFQVFWEGTDPRRFTPPAPAIFGLLAMAYFTWNRFLRVVTIILFLFIGGQAVGKMYAMTSSVVKQEDYRQVSRIINENRQPEDVIVFYGGTCGNQTWRFYDPGNSIFANPKYSPHDFSLAPITRADTIFSAEMFATTIDTLLGNHSAVWMVVSNNYPPRILPLVEPWYDTYSIEVIYTDQFLLLLKIGPRQSQPQAANSNHSEQQ